MRHAGQLLLRPAGVPQEEWGPVVLLVHQLCQGAPACQLDRQLYGARSQSAVVLDSRVRRNMRVRVLIFVLRSTIHVRVPHEQ